MPLSKDHSPVEPKERKRIEQAGGHVEGGRVCGSLEVSRSFGDLRLKRLGLSASPDVTSFAVGAAQRVALSAAAPHRPASGWPDTTAPSSTIRSSGVSRCTLR